LEKIGPTQKASSRRKARIMPDKLAIGNVLFIF